MPGAVSIHSPPVSLLVLTHTSQSNRAATAPSQGTIRTNTRPQAVTNRCQRRLVQQQMSTSQVCVTSKRDEAQASILLTRGRSKATHRGRCGHPGDTVNDANTPGLHLQSLGGVSCAGPCGESLLLGQKSPSSGSTSSSKIVSRGRGLGLGCTATSGRFLGFLELENHRQSSRLGCFRTAPPLGPGGPVQPTQVLGGPELVSERSFPRT